MRLAIACADGSPCRASALATATWSASDLCWLSLKLPAMRLDRHLHHDDRPHQHLAARFATPGPAVQAGFGASQLSNCAAQLVQMIGRMVGRE